MVDNWRLLGGVKVGLCCIDGEDSMLCLLISVMHGLFTTS
jgi:hypothetical protein